MLDDVSVEVGRLVLDMDFDGLGWLVEGVVGGVVGVCVGVVDMGLEVSGGWLVGRVEDGVVVENLMDFRKVLKVLCWDVMSELELVSLKN